jgi:hypothetical protein
MPHRLRQDSLAPDALASYQLNNARLKTHPELVQGQ